jgi:hypothetical protein
LRFSQKAKGSHCKDKMDRKREPCNVHYHIGLYIHTLLLISTLPSSATRNARLCQHQTGPTLESAHKSYTTRLIQLRQDSVYILGINGEDKSISIRRLRLLTNVSLDVYY